MCRTENKKERKEMSKEDDFQTEYLKKKWLCYMVLHLINIIKFMCDTGIKITHVQRILVQLAGLFFNAISYEVAVYERFK